MSFAETFRIALDSLLSNRMRAVLTTLGIIIGIGAVIGLISLGRGVQTFVAAEFEGLGSNLVVAFSSRPASPTRERIQPISTVEVSALMDSSVAPSLVAAAPVHITGATVVFRANSTRQSLSGVSPNYTQVRNYRPLLGTFITQEHLDDKARVAVLGNTIADDLFEGLNPAGQMLRINGLVFDIIGVMELTNELAGENNAIFVPITTSQQRLTQSRTRDGGYRVSVVYFQAANDQVMSQATREVEAFLTQAHGIQFDGEQDFTVINQQDVLNALGAITGVLTVFLTLIAGVSLVVGGIGIMNIMLVSVTERTREIGIRKALGAQNRDILAQFLVESVLLALLGAAIGIALGWLTTVIGTLAVEQLSLSVTWDAVALAVGVSSAIGVFFGFYPAWQASRLRPIDALRYE